MKFERDIHFLTVKSPDALAAGMTDSLVIHYRGRINEEACFSEIDEEKREALYYFFLFKVDKRYSILTPDYVLLTPENLWYPVAKPICAYRHKLLRHVDADLYRAGLNT